MCDIITQETIREASSRLSRLYDRSGTYLGRRETPGSAPTQDYLAATCAFEECELSGMPLPPFFATTPQGVPIIVLPELGTDFGSSPVGTLGSFRSVIEQLASRGTLQTNRVAGVVSGSDIVATLTGVPTSGNPIAGVVHRLSQTGATSVWSTIQAQIATSGFDAPSGVSVDRTIAFIAAEPMNVYALFGLRVAGMTQPSLKLSEVRRGTVTDTLLAPGASFLTAIAYQVSLVTADSQLLGAVADTASMIWLTAKDKPVEAHGVFSRYLNRVLSAALRGER